MKVLLLNQCFWPDVVATAQQLTDLGRGLSARNHEVTVIAGARGYDDPKLRFPKSERWYQIDIRRVSALSMGKRSRWRRALNFASFLCACAFRLAVTPRQDVVVALTSPPLISWMASLFVRLKGGRLVFWVMDLNPDEAIAAGWLKGDSMTAKVLESFLRSSMRQAEKIVVLDRFMKERIRAKGISESKIAVIPPWSYDDAVRYDKEGREAFRSDQQLSGKFVVMYAGNHSPCHPLDTLLGAARELKDRDDIVFCFVGGGSELYTVKEFSRANQLANVRCLPYQPHDALSGVLSAADLHVVVMGEPFAGILHPSKIYNILSVGSPFLYIGPAASHMSDIIARESEPMTALPVQHGQVSEVTRFIIESAARFDPTAERQPSALAREFSRSILLPRIIAEIEAGPALVANTAEPVAAKLQSA